MDLALINLQWLICHKTKPNQMNLTDGIHQVHLILFSCHLCIRSFYRVISVSTPVHSSRVIEYASL